jgi:hypothetical protein
VTLARAFRLTLALTGGLNLAQSSTVHIMVPIASKESVRQFDFFIIRGPPAGLVRWLHWGEDGVPICPSGVKAKKEDQFFEALARAAV